jgi:pyruvate,water dikinase
MWELGRRLATRRLIRQESDVRFLEITEAFAALRSGQKYVDIIQTRKLARPMTLAYWERPRQKVKRVEGSHIVLHGLAASSGMHTGTAIVLKGEKDFDRLRCGDILVSVTINPSWTPLFGKAGAVVTDLGGPLSHAAIVAREFNMPAVLNTGHATSTLIDGVMYTVDGNNGTVLTGTNNE